MIMQFGTLIKSSWSFIYMEGFFRTSRFLLWNGTFVSVIFISMSQSCLWFSYPCPNLSSNLNHLMSVEWSFRSCICGTNEKKIRSHSSVTDSVNWQEISMGESKNSFIFGHPYICETMLMGCKTLLSQSVSPCAWVCRRSGVVINVSSPVLDFERRGHNELIPCP